MRTLCPSRHELQDFTLGQVPETVGLEVEQHLSQCPACIATLDNLQPVDTLVEAVKATEISRLKLPSSDAILRVIQDVKKMAAEPSKSDSRELAVKQLWSMLPPGADTDELARIGPYRILGVLGCGGMGVVLLGDDTQLRRRVAIKVLSPLLAAQDSARKRFLREARAAATITHPNLTPIYHVGEENGLPYFVMPYLEGESLEARLRRESPLPAADIIKIGRQLADGLAAAHEHGLLHRDIKPANIWLEQAGVRNQEAGVRNQEAGVRCQESARAGKLPQNTDNPLTPDSRLLTPDFEVRLLDFGLSWVADEGERLTECGTIIGTPPFMSPEQARGERVDARSDLFALGSVLYLMCSGKAPFCGDSVYGTLEQVRNARPRSVRELNPQLPPQLAAIVDKLHEKHPSQRFQNAFEVARALAQVPLSTCEGDSKVHRFRFRAFVALLLCLGLGLAGLLASNVGNPGGPRSAVSNQRPGSSTQRSAVSTQQSAVSTQPTVAAKPVTNEPLVASNAPSAVEPAPAPPAQQEAKEDGPTVYPAALFTFEERGIGVKDFGNKVADLLFARLAVRPEIYLVDRADIKKTLAELELNLSGAVKANEAARIGQLTGAKLMIFGSVLQVDKRTFIVAKIIGTETSRLVGVSVDGKSADELAPLVEKLADLIADKVKEQADKLVAKAATPADRLANLKKTLKKGDRPNVMVQVTERHVGATPIDPAVQTEVTRFLRETGFNVIDPELGLRSKADVLILGEAISETAARNGNLVSVKARVELRAVDRATDKIITADRQTTLTVDLTEQIAGKSALEEAGAILAERILPKLVKE